MQQLLGKDVFIRNFNAFANTQTGILRYLWQMRQGSCIDFCNSLFFVVPYTHVKKLQNIQNSLARIVTQTLRYTVSHNQVLYIPQHHKTLEVCDLHWLPVCSRLHFKINWPLRPITLTTPFPPRILGGDIRSYQDNNIIK